MAKSLKDRVLEELKKEASSTLDISRRLRIPCHYVRWQLLLLEEKGLTEYDFATGKWRPKKR